MNIRFTYKLVTTHQSVNNFSKCRCLAFRCCCKALIIGSTQQDQSGSWIPGDPEPGKMEISISVNLVLCEIDLIWPLFRKIALKAKYFWVIWLSE